MKLSIKQKVTLWFSSLMIFVVIVILSFMLLISDTVVEEDSLRVLKDTVKANSGLVTYDGEYLDVGDGFLYYSDGINTLVYTKDYNLIAGQNPAGYDKSEIPFINNRIQKSVINGEENYIYDTYIYLGKNNGVWVRGIMRISGAAGTIRHITEIAFVALPLIVILAAVVGYIITKKAFSPVNKIILSANKIRSGNDLSARIELGEAKDEIYYLAKTFDEMFERLEESFLAEKAFSSDASHELRTPLSVIVGECKYLEGSDDIVEYKESVEVISRQAAKMTDLVNRLLEITRIEQRTADFSMEEINLSELIISICETYENNSMNVTVNVSVMDNVYMKGDYVLVMRSLSNFIENAIKYNKQGGRVDVTLAKDAEDIIITVSDTGKGISRENLPKIFRRFYREDNSRSDDSFGLGLFFAHRIITLHGGSVNVSSAVGEGTTFEIRFKRYE